MVRGSVTMLRNATVVRAMLAHQGKPVVSCNKTSVSCMNPTGRLVERVCQRPSIPLFVARWSATVAAASVDACRCDSCGHPVRSVVLPRKYPFAVAATVCVRLQAFWSNNIFQNKCKLLPHYFKCGRISRNKCNWTGSCSFSSFFLLRLSISELSLVHLHLSKIPAHIN